MHPRAGGGVEFGTASMHCYRSMPNTLVRKLRSGSRSISPGGSPGLPPVHLLLTVARAKVTTFGVPREEPYCLGLHPPFHSPHGAFDPKRLKHSVWPVFPGRSFSCSPFSLQILARPQTPVLREPFLPPDEIVTESLRFFLQVTTSIIGLLVLLRGWLSTPKDSRPAAEANRHLLRPFRD